MKINQIEIVCASAKQRDGFNVDSLIEMKKKNEWATELIKITQSNLLELQSKNQNLIWNAHNNKKKW